MLLQLTRNDIHRTSSAPAAKMMTRGSDECTHNCQRLNAMSRAESEKRERIEFVGVATCRSRGAVIRPSPGAGVREHADVGGHEIGLWPARVRARKDRGVRPASAWWGGVRGQMHRPLEDVCHLSQEGQ